MQTPLIIGGGPAGSAAAIILAKAGARPTILERNRETGDALCGGFVSWRTLESLAALGISAEELGGHHVSALRLFAGKRMATAPLPGGAVGVSRRRLDTLLLERAAAAGAQVERGIAVRRLEPGNRIVTSDSAEMRAEALFIATGKHDLAGLGRPRADDPALGLRVRLAAHPALTKLMAESIELHLFDQGYVGLVLQESGDANLCLAVRKSRLAEAGGDPLRLLQQIAERQPALGERLRFMADTPRIDAIGAVPYGWIGVETPPGRFRLGDQAGVIPSLAGEGNGIAIASGMRAAQAWLSGGARAAPQFQRQFAASVRRPIGLAKRLWHLCESPLGGHLAVTAMQIAPRLAAMMADRTRIGAKIGD